MYDFSVIMVFLSMIFLSQKFLMVGLSLMTTSSLLFTSVRSVYTFISNARLKNGNSAMCTISRDLITPMYYNTGVCKKKVDHEVTNQ